jgi:archaellum component FlaC
MKILFAVSLLAIIAAAVLAFQTRSKLIEARQEKDDTNRQILSVHENVNKVNTQTDTVWHDWKATQENAKNEDIARKGLERDTNELDTQLKDLMKAIEDIRTKRENMEAEIKAIIGRDGTPEEVVAKVEELRGITEALEKELATLKGDMEVARKAAGESDTESARRKGQQNYRDKVIALSGRTASVMEVNNEFSFVLLNVGRNDGLTADSKLMVKSGDGTHIANLKIVAIEANRTVADIELRTLRAGAQVMPGNRVVIENTQQ